MLINFKSLVAAIILFGISMETTYNTMHFVVWSQRTYTNLQFGFRNNKKFSRMKNDKHKIAGQDFVFATFSIKWSSLQAFFLFISPE